MNKRKTIIRFGNGYDYLEQLLDSNETFSLSSTNQTMNFKYKDYSIVYTKDAITKNEMFLQKRIKKVIKDNVVVSKLPKSRPRIDYFNFSNSLEYMTHARGEIVEINNLAEMDITKAYYYTAYNLGLIDKEFFEKCFNLRKDIRLRLIGSIATSKIERTFKDGEQTGFKVVEDRDLRKAWFYICSIVDKCLRRCSKAIGNDFLFYWVDGIYYKTRNPIPSHDFNSKVLKKIFKQINYDYKIVDCQRLLLKNEGNNITINVHKEGKIKLFTIPTSNVKKYAVINE